MKTLIEIDRTTWGKVKYFATIKEHSINKAVELLLESALSKFEVNSRKQEGKVK